MGEEITSKYGVLHGISSSDYFDSGDIKDCMLNEFNEIETKYGKLIPRYQLDPIRGKYIPSMSFYKEGLVKSIALNEQTNIKTPYGTYPVEHITFYETGSIKRLFPLNGRITGFWTEENEYNMAKELNIALPNNDIKAKIQVFNFYQSGKLKSITLWPQNKLEVKLSSGVINVRIGISFYESGKIKSCEPALPTPINTPIGPIKSFDINAIGLSGDSNSLNFYIDGSVKSLLTVSNEIEVIDKEGNIKSYFPGRKPNLFNMKVMDIVPLKIEFGEDTVKFNDQSIYEISKNIFNIKSYKR